MRAIYFSALLLAPSAAVCAAEPEPSKVVTSQEVAFAHDLAVFAENIRTAFPTVQALSAVVVREDHVMAQVNFGVVGAANDIPASTETRWYIASSTKAFVGAALALLAERGEIDLEWTLAELAPDIEFPPELHAQEVTLRHLLSHTHGLAGEEIEFRLAYSGQHDPQELWKLLPTLQPNEKSPLGTFEYGNVGYNIATMLIERRLGRRWQDIIDKDLTGPLDMRATLTQELDAARRTEPFAYPYAGNRASGPEPLYLYKHDQTMQSAGGMYSSSNDMALWLESQLAVARGHRSGQLAAAIRKSQSPIASLEADFGPFQRRGYGLGWYSGLYDGMTNYHAFGSFVGAMAHASFMPEANLAVAAMTNEDGVGAMAPHLLAAFAYDWFLLGPDNAKSEGKKRLADLESAIAAERDRVERSQAQRASRSWQLSRSFSEYSGRYCIASMGTIDIIAQDGGLGVKFGVLRAVAEPFTAQDTIRLELIPGRGMVGSFAIEGERVVSLDLLEKRFSRCE